MSTEWIENNIARLKVVQAQIYQACEQAGRSPEEVKLVLVSKTIPIEIINGTLEVAVNEKLLDPKQIILGENKVQEAFNKFTAWENNSCQNSCQDSALFRRHFIGHLQTNKVNKIIPHTHLLHSLDRWSLAEKIAQLANATNQAINALIQVNIAREETKFGLFEGNVLNFIKSLRQFPLIKVKGLMTMAPHAPKEVVEPTFQKLYQLKTQINQEFPELTELSMGMSNDFTSAIKFGATIIRVGSSIFGERNYT